MSEREEIAVNTLPAPPTLDARALREGLRKTYARIALFPNRAHHIHTGRAHTERLGYPKDLVAGVPDVALDAFCGMAYPFATRGPQVGETVLDIGSGSGTDLVIAARAVGAEGRVIGVDPVAEMLSGAAEAVRKAKLTNTELHSGDAEALPVSDGSVDLVIANGVINQLIPDKLTAFREALRVLRPGGQMLLADVFVGVPMPPPVREEVSLWTT